MWNTTFTAYCYAIFTNVLIDLVLTFLVLVIVIGKTKYMLWYMFSSLLLNAFPLFLIGSVPCWFEAIQTTALLFHYTTNVWDDLLQKRFSAPCACFLNCFGSAIGQISGRLLITVHVSPWNLKGSTSNKVTEVKKLSKYRLNLRCGWASSRVSKNSKSHFHLARILVYSFQSEQFIFLDTHPIEMHNQKEKLRSMLRSPILLAYRG